MDDVHEAVSALLCDDSGSEWEKEACTDSETSFSNASIEHTPAKEIKENVSSKVPPPSKEHLDALKDYFGHSSFRPMQWKIIHSIIEKKEDNCVIMATGYGKSLCYQYPAVFLNGTTVVVSPLISLMQDQVLSLQVANISSCLLGSAQSDKSQVINKVMKGKYRIVYVTPEYLTGSQGDNLLSDMLQNGVNLTLVAIDEAHCVSQWGHDFRASFRRLGKVRNAVPQVPFLAVTATATPEVRKDIINSLNLREANLICTGFDRPNLYLKVFPKGISVFEDLRPFMVKEEGRWTFKGPAIIYCPTKKKTTEIDVLDQGLLKYDEKKQNSLMRWWITLQNANTWFLVSVNKTPQQGYGVSCDEYHAGLKLDVRKEVHEKFVKDKIKVIVATVAFGMGIDKPDVRFIIHYGAPHDIESYYQEIGRAGRDGLPASCLVFYTTADFSLNRHFSSTIVNAQFRKHKEEMSHLIESYLETTECRRRLLLSHFSKEEVEKFGDEPMSSTCCDNCTRKLAMKNSGIKEKNTLGLDPFGRYDFTEDARLLVGAIDALGGHYGFGLPIMFLRGSKTEKLKADHTSNPLYGKGKHKPDDYWRNLGRLLLREGYIEENNKKPFGMFGKKSFPIVTVSVSAKGRIFLSSCNGKSKSNKEKPKVLLIPPAKIVDLLKKQNKETSRSHGGAHMLLASLPGEILFSSGKPEDLTSTGSEMDLPAQHNLYAELIKLRNALAVVNDCMPYMVAPDTSLLGMAKSRPSNLENLKKVDGLNEAKIHKFGNAFIDKIVKFCQQNSLQLDNQGALSSVSSAQQRVGCSTEDNVLTSCLTDTVQHTYVAFQLQRRDLEEIERIRKLKESTLISHLAGAIAEGLQVDLCRLGFSYDTFRTIEDIVISKSLIIGDMKNIMAARRVCPDTISWNEVKLAAGILILKEKTPNITAFREKLRTLFQDPRIGTDVPSRSENLVTSLEENQKGSPDIKQRLSCFQMKKMPKETIVKYKNYALEDVKDANSDMPLIGEEVSSPSSSISFRRPLFLSSPDHKTKLDDLEQNEAHFSRVVTKNTDESDSSVLKLWQIAESAKQSDGMSSSGVTSFVPISQDSTKSSLLLKMSPEVPSKLAPENCGSKRKTSGWLEAKKEIKKRKAKLANL